MNNALSKADQNKINKLEEAFDQLISGEKKLFFHHQINHHQKPV